MQKLASVEGHRWPMEDDFETAKNELGLDHNESRSWYWLASQCLTRHAGLRHDGRANTGPLLKERDRSLDRSIVLDPLAIQEIRRIATKLARRRISHAHTRTQP
ncbi:hypothetical protein ACVJGD_005397 [Bradyrhizobium sp. USDA 10063]